MDKKFNSLSTGQFRLCFNDSPIPFIDSSINNEKLTERKNSVENMKKNSIGKRRSLKRNEIDKNLKIIDEYQNIDVHPRTQYPNNNYNSKSYTKPTSNDDNKIILTNIRKRRSSIANLKSILKRHIQPSSNTMNNDENNDDKSTETSDDLVIVQENDQNDNQNNNNNNNKKEDGKEVGENKVSEVKEDEKKTEIDTEPVSRFVVSTVGVPKSPDVSDVTSAGKPETKSSVRFLVQPTEKSPIHYEPRENHEENVDDKKPILVDTERQNLIPKSIQVQHEAHVENDLPIFEKKGLSKFLENMKNYSSVMPSSEHEKVDSTHGSAGTEEDAEKSKGSRKSANLGTMLGVYLPCCQNIFGVLLFIRFSWIVGHAGLLETLALIFTCASCTFLTAISLSAIATNGIVSGGGPYFMISRSLGPEIGGAIGVLFWLGNTVGCAQYLVGAVEILLKYISPKLSLFGDVEVMSNAFNNYRVYGTILLVIVLVCTLFGIKFVSKVGLVALVCVLFAILCLFAGFIKTIFSPPSDRICLYGNRLMRSNVFTVNGTAYCTGEQFCNSTNGEEQFICPIYDLYTKNIKNISNFIAEAEVLSEQLSDVTKKEQQIEDRATLINDLVSKVRYVPAFPGYKKKVIESNLWKKYMKKGEVLPEKDGDFDGRGEVVSQDHTSWIFLIGILFPAVTGVMAGSNRSGDLKDAAGSIPIGTLAAQLTTTVVYILCFILFGATIDEYLLRDKFGDSIGKAMTAAKLSWPHYWVFLIGAFLSTVGAGLQSLASANRLLNAVAKDDIIPVLKFFKPVTKRGEPIRAILITTVIAEFGILIANIDNLTPIVSIFFLMCYLCINATCAIQTITQEPNWRPRFKYYHWTLSIIGMLLCIVIMFLCNWYYALVAVAIAVVLYKYIEYKGAENEWGVGVRGLNLKGAIAALLRLSDKEITNVRSWRPQLLLFASPSPDLQVTHEKLFHLAHMLKTGKGLTIACSLLEGDYLKRYPDVEVMKRSLRDNMGNINVKGFTDVVVTPHIKEGISSIIQTNGIGGLRANTIVIDWPKQWRQHWGDMDASGELFLHFVRACEVSHRALIVTKGLDNFPEKTDRLKGTMDIWWIIHDGGLLLLLTFLLKKHRTWENCALRVFAVAQVVDNSVQMKIDLERYLYYLRIKAEVEVVEMVDQSISAYTYERTMKMEQRRELIKSFKQMDPQQIIDNAHNVGMEKQPEPPIAANIEDIDLNNLNQYTFTPAVAAKFTQMFHKDNAIVRKMHTAVKLNETIVKNSQDAQLVIINLPSPPKFLNSAADYRYMEYCEALTQKLDRLLVIRGSGKEVVTIFS
ncbi:hypothetical protein SNEBB_004455 [Seison nebaliae]|nr:hypothetical protein SNEBB_004455 [Seison nebaliae]